MSWLGGGGRHRVWHDGHGLFFWPPADATHWSLRSMARSTDYAPSTIHRIWRAFELQPHRSKSFKLSSDPFWEYST